MITHLYLAAIIQLTPPKHNETCYTRHRMNDEQNGTKQLKNQLRRLWVGIVRLGFRLLYNEMAWTYDVVSWIVSLGQWRAWQRAALLFVQGCRVLEIGHGPGHMLLALQKAGVQGFGLDLSPQMGRQARRRLQKAGQPIRLARGAVQSLPFAKAAFNTVLATFPTDYIVAPDTLASIYRVLASDGRLVIVPEGHLTGHSWLHRFIGWLFYITGQRSGPFAVDGTMTWPDTAVWEPFRRRFAAAGFRVDIRQITLPRSQVTVIIAQK